VDEFACQLSVFFNAHHNFLEEVAKFRAARRLWARLMRERFDTRHPDSCRLRFHTHTAGSTLTAQQPENNVIRVTLQALAAVLGGTQSLHTNSMDEALGLPTRRPCGRRCGRSRSWRGIKVAHTIDRWPGVI
jgi:methylmalonyl-CoA mutase N-terminal domain/subunit